MVDQILAVSVVLLPTLFAVGIEVVSKEIKEHLNWRIAVLGFGVGLSVLTWFQMSRAANNARKDQEDAIKTTATKVSELERNIREKLGQNNEDRVSFDLYLQSANGRKYIMHTTLWEIVKDGQITIHTQNNGYEERDWSKQPS